MSNDSTTSGYLTPVDTPAPPEDVALENFLHDWLQAVSGFADPTAVRPRWQPEPPIQPDFGTDWLAFGVTESVTDFDAWEGHDPTGLGTDNVMLTEELTIALSYYGPNAMSNALAFRINVKVGQNRDVLTAAGMGYISATDATNAPTLTKSLWVRRVDLELRLRRNVTRAFQVRSLLSANGAVNNELYTTPFVTPGS